jgi:hypothetical protein
MADRACILEPKARAYIADDANSTANYTRARPSVFPLNLFLPLTRSPPSPPHPQYTLTYRGFGRLLGDPSNAFWPAPLFGRSDPPILSPLSTLHAVVLGLLPGVHGHHLAYPIAQDTQRHLTLYHSHILLHHCIFSRRPPPRVRRRLFIFNLLFCLFAPRSQPAQPPRATCDDRPRP